MIIQDRCLPMVIFKLEDGEYYRYSTKKKDWEVIDDPELVQIAIDLSNSYSDCKVISEEEAREVIKEYLS